MRPRHVLFSLAILSAAMPARAQEKPPVKDTTVTLPAWRLRLVGVYDGQTGEPVEGADVIDVLNGNSAKTTSTGTVALAFMPEGTGFVRIRKLGYELQTIPVTISPDDSLPLTVILTKAVLLEGVSVVDSVRRYVSPKLQGFEQRRTNAAAGQFLGEGLVRKEENRNIGEFLRGHLSNAVLRDGRNGSVYLMQSSRCGRGSAPAVYLDGALLSPDTPGAPVNLAEIKLTDLAGVEYYPNTATAPPQYNGTARSCGALLLWSRER